MRKLLYVLIFVLIDKLYLFSFPIVESNPFTQIELADEDDKKLNKNKN